MLGFVSIPLPGIIKQKEDIEPDPEVEDDTVSIPLPGIIKQKVFKLLQVNWRNLQVSIPLPGIIKQKGIDQRVTG